jgi:hypothetical protein
MQTAAPPLPTPKRSKRRWYLVGGFVLFLLATPIISLTIADQWREHELEKIYRELDAEDPNWRWADLVAEIPALPDEQNAIVQIRNVKGLLRKSAFMMPPVWYSEAKQKSLETRNARLSQVNAEMLRAAFKTLDPKVMPAARRLKDFPNGRINIDPTVNYFEFVSDDFQYTRELMALLDSDVMLRAHDNDLEGAAEAWHALLNTSHALGDNPTMIGQLVRIAGQTIALGALERLLGQGELSEPDLAKIQSLLQRELGDNALYQGLRGDRAGVHQTYLDLHAGKTTLTKITLNPKSSPNLTEKAADLFPNLITRGYPEYLRLLNECVAASKLKDEDRLEAMEKLDQKARDNRSNVMIRIFMPGANKVAHAYQRTQAGLRCAMAAVAVERYRIKNDAWPRGFDDLLKDRLLNEIPADPFDGKLLRFKRSATGIIIYSVGFDKIDNHGNLDRYHPFTPDCDIGFKLWDRQLRASVPPVEEEK